MTGSDAFVWKIMDHPEADLPRLVFADWLQDQGAEAHAEFIRLQCELETMTEDDDGWMAKKIREGELFWEKLRREWEPAWEVLTDQDLRLSHFSRGFVSELDAHLEWRTWRRSSTAAFAQDDRWPFLLRLATLRCSETLSPAFFASPQMQRVTRLICTGAQLVDAAMGALASSPYYSRVTAIDLSRNQIGDAGAIALAGSPGLTAVRSLDLSENADITHVGLEVLARTPNLPGLRELRVGRQGSANPDVVAALRELYYRYGDGFDSWTEDDEERHLNDIYENYT